MASFKPYFVQEYDTALKAFEKKNHFCLVENLNAEQFRIKMQEDDQYRELVIELIPEHEREGFVKKLPKRLLDRVLEIVITIPNNDLGIIEIHKELFDNKDNIFNIIFDDKKIKRITSLFNNDFDRTNFLAFISRLKQNIFRSSSYDAFILLKRDAPHFFVEQEIIAENQRELLNFEIISRDKFYSLITSNPLIRSAVIDKLNQLEQQELVDMLPTLYPYHLLTNSQHFAFIEPLFEYHGVVNCDTLISLIKDPPMTMKKGYPEKDYSGIFKVIKVYLGKVTLTKFVESLMCHFKYDTDLIMIIEKWNQQEKEEE